MKRVSVPRSPLNIPLSAKDFEIGCQGVVLNFSDKFLSSLILPLPALVAKWQTRTLEVRVEKSMGVRVSPSALAY